MTNTSIIIAVIVIGLVLYLIYSHNNTPKKWLSQLAKERKPDRCVDCDRHRKRQQEQYSDRDYTESSHIPERHATRVDNKPFFSKYGAYDGDGYSDPIKRMDKSAMYDPLSYPQLRLPREVLEKYEEYYKENGSYPPFYESTRPLFDTPILNGILIKEVDDNEPFGDNIPSTIPLFKIKSAKNVNRFYYYVLDQRHHSKLELKIPLDNVKINGVRYTNTDFYGLPEIYDNDIIENISVFPGTRFKVFLYKTHHFP